MIAKNKRFVVIMLIAAMLLLMPLIATPLTDEVRWSPFDFLIAAVLLFGFGMLIELALRKIKKTPYRILMVGGIFLVLFLIWAELAVGVFGTPFAGS